MRLQIGGLIGDHGVGRAVRLVEAILGELGHLIVELFRLVGGDPLLASPRDKFLPQLRHLLRLFLPHGLAQPIRVGRRKSRQFHGDLHDLLLIQDHAIGIIENLFQLRNLVGDQLPVVSAFDIVIHHAAFQGARTVQGQQVDDILKGPGLHTNQEIPHPRAFKLKDAGNLPLPQERVGLFVIKLDRLQVEIGVVFLFNERNRPLDHGKSG